LHGMIVVMLVLWWKETTISSSFEHTLPCIMGTHDRYKENMLTFHDVGVWMTTFHLSFLEALSLSLKHTINSLRESSIFAFCASSYILW
jgi:hypothetical protein